VSFTIIRLQVLNQACPCPTAGVVTATLLPITASRIIAYIHASFHECLCHLSDVDTTVDPAWLAKSLVVRTVDHKKLMTI